MLCFTILVLLLVPDGVGAHVVGLVGLGGSLLIAEHLLEELELRCRREDEEEEGEEEGWELHFRRFG